MTDRNPIPNAARLPDELLEITYPTADVQHALDAVSAASAGRPIVLLGQRGSGKSHIMALLHNSFAVPDAVETGHPAGAVGLNPPRN